MSYDPRSVKLMFAGQVIVPYAEPDGKHCARSACGSPRAYCWNTSALGWYCQPCAFKINDASGGEICKRDEFVAKWGRTCGEIWPDPAAHASSGEPYACGCVVTDIVEGSPITFTVEPCALHRV